MSVLAVIKILHYAGFAACLYASFQKNRLLAPATISQAQVARLRLFDKVSGSAAGLMVLTGAMLALWFAKPTPHYLTSPLFWFKITLFIVASALVVRTKRAFAAALATEQAQWKVPAHVRSILRFDFLGLIVLAILGRWLAAGQIF